MFDKILIANRGEIALRIIRTCKELGIKTVAVYSEADADSLHVRFADEAVCIGPPASAKSYLNIPQILAAAEITNAAAIHPGYGFLAENAQFAEMCEQSGFVFVGPTAEMIRKMGDKAVAKSTVQRVGVPTVPGSDGVVADAAVARKIADKIGYPVLLKAAAGGGGKGMRIIREPAEIEEAWATIKREAQAAFGNDDIYLEKFIENPRHIEIQIVGDKYGTISHLSERDCSIQRRHQKLIEESPSPFVDPELREKMGQAAIKAAEAVGYESVGTVEFIVDEQKNFYFMEMNTRIQVEHPVTEEVINYDLIKEQILVAAGVPVSGKNHYPRLHAIECRINAEDPFCDFRPSPGRIEVLHVPGGHGVRVDTHVYASYVVPPFYDSLIAKLIVTGRTRQEAIVRMQRALEEFVLEGIQTTIPLHRKIMKHPDFIEGRVTTKFMEHFKLGSPEE